MALLHRGIFHSYSVSGCVGVRGRRILTDDPVASTPPNFTSPAFAVTHSRASAPPPVSSASSSPVRGSRQRGDMTQVYLPPADRSRACGLGSVVWFHGWRRSTGLP